MTIGQERAAFRAYQWLQAFGADVRPTHRLPNRLGYFDPETGAAHGPEPITIAGMPLAEWNERCKRYAERMAAIPPERKRHAYCDHANGYCADGSYEPYGR